MTDTTKQQHEKLTQQYSTWGDKLLQHTDVLHSIQKDRKFKPITIQLAPTEGCDSACVFCSVSGRPIKRYMSFESIIQCLTDFRKLGAKSVELTGGGNPLIYKDKDAKKNINDIIRVAADLGYDIGIITNSEKLTKIDPTLYDKINWIRISLIKLDEGCEPEDYDFAGFPYEKLAFSYIIYGAGLATNVKKTPMPGTSEATIERIAKLVELHNGQIKFVRFAGDCLIKGNNLLVRKSFSDIVEQNDQYKKFFLKTIDDQDDAYDDGCYVGLIRPYVAADPDGGEDHHVYICTSHVLNKRTYDKDYALCKVADIIETWNRLNENFEKTGRPYEVKDSKKCGWNKTCNHCFYKNNNKLLHTVACSLPDKNFP